MRTPSHKQWCANTQNRNVRQPEESPPSHEDGHGTQAWAVLRDTVSADGVRGLGQAVRQQSCPAYTHHQLLQQGSKPCAQHCSHLLPSTEVPPRVPQPLRSWVAGQGSCLKGSVGWNAAQWSGSHQLLLEHSLGRKHLQSSVHLANLKRALGYSHFIKLLQYKTNTSEWIHIFFAIKIQEENRHKSQFVIKSIQQLYLTVNSASHLKHSICAQGQPLSQCEESPKCCNPSHVPAGSLPYIFRLLTDQ